MSIVKYIAISGLSLTSLSILVQLRKNYLSSVNLKHFIYDPLTPGLIGLLLFYSASAILLYKVTIEGKNELEW